MKKFGMLVLLGVLVVGCGGGSSSSGEKYDMWDYIASEKSKTYTLDSYKSNSSYSTTTNKTTNAGYIEYTSLSENKKRVDFNGEITAIFELNGNNIKIADTSIARYKSIGSKIGECKLSKHYDTFTAVNTYTFSDVLEFDCDGYKEFYVKGKGNIINYARTTYINGDKEVNRYAISVANNAN